MREMTMETFYVINQTPKINRAHWNLTWMIELHLEIQVVENLPRNPRTLFPPRREDRNLVRSIMGYMKFPPLSTGKVFSFSHESQQSPAHFSSHFKANEILFYLRPGNKGKKVWSPLQDNTVSFYCKTKQVTSNYTQRPTGCTTCSLDNVYVAVNFLFRLIFVFPLFQIH